MRSKRIVALALLSISMLSVGCGKKESAGAKDSATPSSVESSTTLAETSKTAEAAQDTLEGVVLDASMNGFTLQNKDLGLVYIETGEDAAEKPDLSKLKNGFTAGEGVKLLGKRNGGDFELGAAADQATALGDKDALYTVGQALFAVRDKNMQALAELAQYPLYLGLESGNEIDSKDELMRKYTAEQIFTEDFTNSVLHCDLLNLREAGGNLVVSMDGGKPNLIFTKTDAGYKLSAINVTK